MVSNRLISCVIRVMLITMLLISSQVVAVQAAGCVLHGRVIDASTGAAIPQAELRVSNRGLQKRSQMIRVCTVLRKFHWGKPLL